MRHGKHRKHGNENPSIGHRADDANHQLQHTTPLHTDLLSVLSVSSVAPLPLAISVRGFRDTFGSWSCAAQCPSVIAPYIGLDTADRRPHTQNTAWHVKRRGTVSAPGDASRFEYFLCFPCFPWHLCLSSSVDSVGSVALNEAFLTSGAISGAHCTLVIFPAFRGAAGSDY